ncbi:MAG: hypothetical protein CMG78_12115 [Marinobacter sp.]|nr:hypothetical protein [Marinobacter sp.]|tara:strand:+ start:1760 stop:2140 length:381 start_codon:yes stop_codon:yes gene_type:complete
MLKVLHAFYPDMLPKKEEVYVHFKSLTPNEVRDLLNASDIDSHIGRAPLVNKLSDMFGLDIECKPGRVLLGVGDTALVVKHFDPGPDSVRSEVISFFHIEVLSVEDVDVEDEEVEEEAEETEEVIA